MRALKAQVGKGGMNYNFACLYLQPPPLYISESFKSASGKMRDQNMLLHDLPPLHFKVKWRKKG